MIAMSYPALSRGVEMARIPSGAVASILEKEATKKTIFFDDFTRAFARESQNSNASGGVCLQIVKRLQNRPGEQDLACFSFRPVTELWTEHDNVPGARATVVQPQQFRYISGSRGVVHGLESSHHEHSQAWL